MRFWLPALIAIAVLPVSAHHPFTPYYDARAFSGNTVTFADGTTMVFGSTTAGAFDSWSCPDPCPYKYPDVQ